MKRPDAIAGAVLFVVSLFLLYQSSRLQMVYGKSIPGTGFLPFWLSVAMVGLSLLLMINGVRRSVAPGGISWPKGRGLLRVLIALGALVAYTSLVTVVGYLLSTFAFLLLLVGMLSTYRWYTVLAFSLTAALSMYLVFGVWLEMSLPKGMLIVP